MAENERPKTLDELKAEGLAEAKVGVREMCERLGLEASETDKLVADVGVNAMHFTRRHRPAHVDIETVRPDKLVLPDVEAKTSKAEREEERILEGAEKARQLEREKELADMQTSLELGL